MSPDEIFGSYTAWKADGGVWFIQFMNGSQNMYLIEGDAYALLIDTGWGAGNIRAFAESLTDKPVMAANTHAHLDHAGGNALWESVYLPAGAEIDLESLERAPVELGHMPYPNYERRYLGDGDLISLGGRDVEVLAGNAHCEGHVFFLDRKAGYLFCGDELESAQVILIANSPHETASLRERCLRHKAAMERLAARLDEIRYICPAHNGAPIAREYIFDYIALDEQMLAGAQVNYPLDHFYIEQRPDHADIRRARCGGASFLYKEEREPAPADA